MYVHDIGVESVNLVDGARSPVGCHTYGGYRRVGPRPLDLFLVPTNHSDVVPGALKRPDLQIDDDVFAAWNPVRIVAVYHRDAHD